MRISIGKITGNTGLDVPGRVTERIAWSSPQAEPPGSDHAEFVICDQTIDITYVPTGEGWLYLATVMDLYSRRIVGWSLGQTLATALVMKALQMALGRRRPAAGVVHHSDRGCQYASDTYRAELALHHLLASMSRSGNCYDNAPMESFFATLKTELFHRCTFTSRAHARREIVGYIEGFYNPTRRHSALGYRSPLEFEAATPVVA